MMVRYNLYLPILQNLCALVTPVKASLKHISGKSLLLILTLLVHAPRFPQLSIALRILPQLSS